MIKVIASDAFITLLGLFLFSSCTTDSDDDCLDSLGPIVTEIRDVDDFHSIVLKGIGNIFLTQGSTKSLSIETNEELLIRLETTVSNETLTVDLSEKDCIIRDIDKLDIFITIPNIESLSVGGVGNITAQNDFDLESLNISLDGVGNATLRGKTDFLETSSSGVGNIHAFDMTAEKCNIVITGVGNVEVTVTSELDVNINGSGNVFYKGNPTVTVDISGSGNVRDSN